MEPPGVQVPEDAAELHREELFFAEARMNDLSAELELAVQASGVDAKIIKSLKTERAEHMRLLQRQEDQFENFKATCEKNQQDHDAKLTASLADNSKLLVVNDKLLADNAKLLAENNKLLADGAKLFANSTKLLEENSRLEACVHNLASGQDFQSHRETAGKSHQRLQTEMVGIQAAIRAWVRSSCKPPLRPPAFSLADLEQLATHPGTRSILRSIVNKPRHDTVIKAMDLLQAIVGQLIVCEVIANPLLGCCKDLREALSSALDNLMGRSKIPPQELGRKRKATLMLTLLMGSVNEKAKRAWHAKVITAYVEAPELMFGKEKGDDKKLWLHKHVHGNATEFAEYILAAVRPIYDTFDHHAPNQSRLVDIVVRAAELGRELGMLESGLRVVNLEYIARRRNGYYYDAWMELKNDALNEDEESPSGTVAVVLYPGLLKIGRDNGSNWESWTVWSKAKVELLPPTPVQDAVPAKAITHQQQAPDLPDHGADPVQEGRT